MQFKGERRNFLALSQELVIGFGWLLIVVVLFFVVNFPY